MSAVVRVVAVALLVAPGCDAVQGLTGGKKEEVAKAGGDADVAKAKAEAAKAEAEAAKAKAEAAKAKAEAAKAEAEAAAAKAKGEEPVAASASAGAGAGAAAPAEPAPAGDDATAEADTAAAPPTLGAATPTAAAGDGPCIVGTWDAVDYRAAIERAIYRDAELRKLKYSHSGGTLGYIVEAPTDNKGSVRQVAENVTYHFGGKIEGFEVALTIKLDGENVADYELEGSDRIDIAPPNKKAMKVNANVNVKGLAKMSKSKKVDLDFEGEFKYTCKDDELEVVAAGDEKGRPLTFKRAKQG